MRRIVLSALAALAVGQAGAAPLSADEEARAHRLAQSLRCPVCQNQTIAESNAPLAQDLREQVQAQVAAGRSDDEVREFMVRRFGDFVLYEPPRTPQTLLLWLGPFALLGGGALVLWRRVRRGAGEAVAEEPDGVAARAGEGT
ncbi:cytochrome c-type biogenesis protein [Azohydromonas caseinilytica]|uniref:cytochrome c-type biogenesis protein n=1 Tax=Azohydromonas caseinilytica TaxID=2728836 RepID=UPI0028735CDB|nr:cytochrome c-type biogenesis protein [Azohydromonas caseinilytica]